MNIDGNLQNMIDTKNDIKNSLLNQHSEPAGGLITYNEAIKNIFTGFLEIDWNNTGYGIDDQNNVENLIYDQINKSMQETKKAYKKYYNSSTGDHLCEDNAKIMIAPNVNLYWINSAVYMFSRCSNLIYIPPYNTANIINMTDMFSYCKSLIMVPELDISKASNMSNMFNSCSLLVEVRFKGGHSGINCAKMFEKITTTGKAYFKNDGGDYSAIISELPYNWTYEYYN